MSGLPRADTLVFFRDVTTLRTLGAVLLLLRVGVRVRVRVGIANPHPHPNPDLPSVS